MNRRRLRDGSIRLLDVCSAHAYMDTCRSRTKVDDVGVGDLPVSSRTQGFLKFLSVLLAFLPNKSRIAFTGMFNTYVFLIFCLCAHYSSDDLCYAMAISPIKIKAPLKLKGKYAYQQG